MTILRLLPLTLLLSSALAAPPAGLQLLPLQESALSSHSSASAAATPSTSTAPSKKSAPKGKNKREEVGASGNESTLDEVEVGGEKAWGKVEAVSKEGWDWVKKEVEGHEKRQPGGLGAGSHDKSFNHKRVMEKKRRVKKRVDSDIVPRDEVEERAATQYAFSNSTATTTSSPGAYAATSTSTTTPSSTKMPAYWYGASSYYLFAMADAERYAVLDALADGGFKVVRIFLAGIGANNKGSNSIAVNDLEPTTVGVYDDTILGLIDQLMYDCSVRGLKLLIAFDDRYALGFWSTNAYALKYGIVAPGSSGVQQIANAANFYTNSDAIAYFDKRLTHIMTHVHPLWNKTWAELDDVIYAVEPQNEPQGHMTMVSTSWTCNRAATLKSLIPANSSILVSSGGGITTTLSLGTWATNCANIDVVSYAFSPAALSVAFVINGASFLRVHDYGTDAAVTVSALVYAAQNAASGKTVMMGEWGMTGANKAALTASFVKAFAAAGLPWMYWEVVKPGKAASDFEVWTDEPSWAALTGGTWSSSTYSTTYPSTSSYKSTSKSATYTSAYPTYSSAYSSYSSKTTSKTTQWSSSSAAWTPSSSAASSTTTGSGRSTSNYTQY
ncbi:beta-1,3-mannanase [Pseudohyphozyma bogoriensis]|nr:beta-1,3-mannanase [Pseudohyphozyma bogoriensis]